MKEKNTLLKNYSLIKLLVLLLLPASVIVSSCNNEGGSHGGAVKESKLNCVILTKAQVQVWVDSGWTKPDSPGRIRKLLLQFYSKDGVSANSNMQLVAYPGQTISNVKVNGKTTLAIDTTCPSYKLSGPVIFSNNEIGLDKLKIFNADGTLNNFDYIRFTPEQYPKDREYLNYKVEIVRGGKPEAVDGDGTWPCPPHCGEPD